MIYLIFKTDSEGELLVGACGTAEEANRMINERRLHDLKLALNAAYDKELCQTETELICKIEKELKKVEEKFRGYSVVSFA